MLDERSRRNDLRLEPSGRKLIGKFSTGAVYLRFQRIALYHCLLPVPPCLYPAPLHFNDIINRSSLLAERRGTVGPVVGPGLLEGVDELVGKIRLRQFEVVDEGFLELLVRSKPVCVLTSNLDEFVGEDLSKLSTFSSSAGGHLPFVKVLFWMVLGCEDGVVVCLECRDIEFSNWAHSGGSYFPEVHKISVVSEILNLQADFMIEEGDSWLCG